MGQKSSSGRSLAASPSSKPSTATMRRLLSADVARRTNELCATARRLLHTLVELGYASTDGKHFSLRAKVLNLGYSYMSSLGLIEIAQPVMSDLAAEVHEFMLGLCDGRA